MPAHNSAVLTVRMTQVEYKALKGRMPKGYTLNQFARQCLGLAFHFTGEDGIVVENPGTEADKDANRSSEGQVCTGSDAPQVQPSTEG
jgi:hypothetical protein